MLNRRKKRSLRAEPRDPKYKHAIMTVPNVICFIRLIGSFVLLGFALANWQYPFVALFLALSLSDWIDGRLARWLNQRSDFGARLDSTADATLYAALIAGTLLLSWPTIKHELVWLSVGIGSYLLTSGAGLWKYGRVPSYHTYGAKITQWLALIAGICMVLDWSVWPLRIATVAVTLTNLEAIAITFALSEWRADVLTLFHVWPVDRQIELADEDE